MRDCSKRSEKYLQKLEKQNFVVTNSTEHKAMKDSFLTNLSLCESIIGKLMSEMSLFDSSNHEQLLDKMLKFQE